MRHETNVHTPCLPALPRYPLTSVYIEWRTIIFVCNGTIMPGRSYPYGFLGLFGADEDLRRQSLPAKVNLLYIGGGVGTVALFCCGCPAFLLCTHGNTDSVDATHIVVFIGVGGERIVSRNLLYQHCYVSRDGISKGNFFHCRQHRARGE